MPELNINMTSTDVLTATMLMNQLVTGEYNSTESLSKNSNSNLALNAPTNTTQTLNLSPVIPNISENGTVCLPRKSPAAINSAAIKAIACKSQTSSATLNACQAITAPTAK